MSGKPIWVLLVLLLAAAAAAGPSEDLGEDNVADDRARRQAERVMNAGLLFAERMLAQHGEFAPFGAAMLHKGLIQTLNPDSEHDATSEAMLQSLIVGLRRGALNGEYKAVGTFTLVELRKPEGEGTFSAVHVALEHLEGYCVDVYYPVVLRGEGLVLEEPVAGKRSGTFFDSCN